jgi:hypothetical protein
MKVRAGFVTNSSSTSFLILTRDELEEGAFLQLMRRLRTYSGSCSATSYERVNALTLRLWTLGRRRRSGLVLIGCLQP